MSGRPVSNKGVREARNSADTDVVAALIRHEEWALKALTQSFGKYVYGSALRIVRDSHLAEEIAQDALLVMWWRPERFDPSKGSLRSFLIGIARFQAIDAVRREESSRTKESLVAENRALLATDSADRGVAEGMELRAALSKLVLTQRQALFLAYYRGFSYREVAEVLDVPEGTIKTRIRDALIKLRTAMRAPTTG